MNGGGVATTATASAAAATATKSKYNNYTPHSVNRSAELLSCAKTALKIAQSRIVQQQQQNDVHTGTNKRSWNNSNNVSNNEWIMNTKPSDLILFHPSNNNNNQQSRQQQQNSPLNNALHDGLQLLQTIELELQQLNQLVRRRGHTNDPTYEISTSVSSVEHNVETLNRIVQSMLTTNSYNGSRSSSSSIHASQQRQRHIKVIQEWFQSMIQQYVTQLKDILSVRATVLQEQARRRGMFQPPLSIHPKNTIITTTTTTSLSTTATTAISSAVVDTTEAQNALFAPIPQQQQPRVAIPAGMGSSPLQKQHNYESVSSKKAEIIDSTRSISNSTGYGGNTYGYNGYGGYGSHTTAIAGDSNGIENGIRRRRQQQDPIRANGTVTTTTNTWDDNNNNNNSEAETQQQQQQQTGMVLEQSKKYRDRQTAVRLREARQAEQSLATLGTIFGKMSTLIVQQSDTIQNIEDDVEAANIDIQAGHDAITNLYSIKKGNRMLIIKVYSLLIFLIIFMRFYVRK